MCLIVRGRKKYVERVADKNITAYKVFKYVGIANEQNMFISPFMAKFFTLGKTYSNSEKFEHRHNIWRNIHYIYGGAYHLFVDFYDAKKFADSLSTDYMKYCVVEAIIPEGSKYVEGIFQYGDDLFRSYAAEKVKYTAVTHPLSVNREYELNEIRLRRLTKEQVVKEMDDLQDIINTEADWFICSRATSKYGLYKQILFEIEWEEKKKKASKLNNEDLGIIC